jgi:hypothetical protein
VSLFGSFSVIRFGVIFINTFFDFFDIAVFFSGNLRGEEGFLNSSLDPEIVVFPGRHFRVFRGIEWLSSNFKT